MCSSQCCNSEASINTFFIDHDYPSTSTRLHYSQQLSCTALQHPFRRAHPMSE
ncbi:MAG TPA: hypothetical protein VGS41_05835 [Chthonomonadales bacterium]|nr:hypothetical protein [Chthonomonadales bacterium]